MTDENVQKKKRCIVKICKQKQKSIKLAQKSFKYVYDTYEVTVGFEPTSITNLNCYALPLSYATIYKLFTYRQKCLKR